jgi:hypothetical protein
LASHGLAKERLGCGHIAPAAQTTIYRPALAINRPIQIDPLPANLNVGLVHPPRCPDRTGKSVPAPLELGRVATNPAHDGGVSHRQTALSHDLRQIAKAEFKAQIPPHTQDDDLAIKMPAGK